MIHHSTPINHDPPFNTIQHGFNNNLTLTTIQHYSTSFNTIQQYSTTIQYHCPVYCMNFSVFCIITLWRPSQFTGEGEQTCETRTRRKNTTSTQEPCGADIVILFLLYPSALGPALRRSNPRRYSSGIVLDCNTRH